ncbi:hypothetical protein MD484_g2735, partial [Candolleomyces efflorescens]
MKFFGTVLASLLAFSAVFAAPVPEDAPAASPVPDVIPPTPQCGGKYWQGATTCTRSHYVCFKFNENYSECIHESRVPQWSVGKPE